METTEDSDLHISLGTLTGFRILSDGILRTEDGYEFHIHRYPLVKRSKYFGALFCGMNSDLKEFLIPGFRGKVLHQILLYIYGDDKFNLTPDIVGDLLLAADFFLLQDCFLKVKEYAMDNITINNCFQIFMASMYTEQQDILNESFRFIQINYTDIAHDESSNIEALSLNALQQILSDRNLCVKDENIIWNSVLRWINADVDNRQSYVPDLLKCLKFAEVGENLASMIIESDVIARNPFYKNIIEVNNPKFLNSNIQILTKLYQEAGLEINAHRSPYKVYLIAHTRFRHSVTECIDIYITYDENIDYWRKICEIPASHMFHIVIRDCFYTSTINKFEKKINRFNFINKEWIPMKNRKVTEQRSFVLKHEGLIYLFIITLFQNNIQVYNPEMNTWNDVTQMFPTTFFSAASLNEKIYVVGLQPCTSKMMLQVFEPKVNKWALLPSPKRYRLGFCLVPYCERLYLIGGKRLLRAVNYADMFDPQRNIWKSLNVLPYCYNSPQAAILKDQLIVYDGSLTVRCSLKPSVRWNNDLECWDPFEVSSVLNDLFMYRFFAIEDFELLRVLTKENRNLVACFEKSPFKCSFLS